MTTCTHRRPCPPAAARDHLAAAIVAAHPEQGWNLLCNGVVVFDDDSVMFPDGTVTAPEWSDDVYRPVAA